jgi:hypothetical protein
MSGRCAGLAAAAALACLVGAPVATAQDAPGVCLGDTSAAGVPMRPGAPLRMGITPAGEAGALGPAVPAVPDQPAKTLAALGRLRDPGGPFVLRLNRFFWSDGDAAIQRFATLVARYTGAGYLVELQLRYHPPAGHDGDVAGFVAWVRDVVHRFGSNPRVVAAQVTNEVNFTISPDSSDGAYQGAKDALIQGVIAAKDQARRDRYDQLRVGFNWFYRTDPSNEEQFWTYLGTHGGPAFTAAVDWVGLDVYPGTVFPPVEYPGGHRDAIVNALSTLRQCWLPKAGISGAVPIHVEENGWPTGSGRSEAQQAQVLDTMVRAVSDFRGTYNVSDYRWFDLRDHDTSSTNFQHHYGLLRDDYTEKPAFAVYARLVRALGAKDPPAIATNAPRTFSLSIGRRGRCGRTLRVRVRGSGAAEIRRVEFLVARRRVAVDRTAPFARSVRLPRRRRVSTVTVRARVVLRDGGLRVLSRRVRLCRS